MRASAFDQAQSRAILTAGAAGGQYLDRIGQTDLGQLDPLNWQQFLEILFETYPGAIRAEIDGAVPRSSEEDAETGEA